MKIERMCTQEGCEHYRGFEKGYCHKYRVVMNSQKKKEFFARNCAQDWDLEALEIMWQSEERMKTWKPES